MDIKFVENFDKRSGYSEPHILKTLLSIDVSVGREKLMKDLGLNEASARTLLNFLKGKGLLKSTKRGHEPTEKCKDVVKFLKTNIKGPIILGKSSITVGNKNIAYIVKNRANKIRYGIEQRDQAIIMGAYGLTTIIKRGKLFMPGMKANINLDVEMKDGDVLLIGSAGTERTAEFAALYASYLLLR